MILSGACTSKNLTCVKYLKDIELSKANDMVCFTLAVGRLVLINQFPYFLTHTRPLANVIQQVLDENLLTSIHALPFLNFLCEEAMKVYFHALPFCLLALQYVTRSHIHDNCMYVLLASHLFCSLLLVQLWIV